MEPEEYKKRELDEKFNSVHETLDAILAQTTKTNGKVAELQAWQSYIKGGLAVLTTIVVPVVLYVVYMMLKVK